MDFIQSVFKALTKSTPWRLNFGRIAIKRQDIGSQQSWENEIDSLIKSSNPQIGPGDGDPEPPPPPPPPPPKLPPQSDAGLGSK